MIKILIVDDEPEIAELLEDVLADKNYETAIAYTRDQAIQKVRDFQPNLVLQDIRLPDGDGIEILQYIKKNYPKTEVIMVTGMADKEIGLESLKHGALDYITKPIDLNYLTNSILANLITSLNNQ